MKKENVYIGFRCSEQEKATLDSLVKISGRSKSAVLRSALKAAAVKTALQDELKIAVEEAKKAESDYTKAIFPGTTDLN